MALGLFEHSTQGAFFVLLVVLAPISIVTTILRFIATRRSRRKFGLEDWAALMAFLVQIASTITSLYGESIRPPASLPVVVFQSLW